MRSFKIEKDQKVNPAEIISQRKSNLVTIHDEILHFNDISSNQEGPRLEDELEKVQSKEFETITEAKDNIDIILN